MPKPDWMQHEAIPKILGGILSKLDQKPAKERTRPIYINNNDRALRGLYEPDYDGEEDYLWDQIMCLVEQKVIALKEGPRNSGDPAWIKCRLSFNYESEDKVRDWLDAPAGAMTDTWSAALESYSPATFDCEFLRSRPLVIPGRQHAVILRQLKAIRSHILQSPERFTLRQLAARFLWGASKALDSRGEAWLSQALDIPAHKIRRRAISAQVHVGRHYSGEVLFIENLDTFYLLCGRDELSSHAIVYLSGYKGAAARIRRTDFVNFYFSERSYTDHHSTFADAWHNNLDMTCSIWGDLDYAGLSIAAALRRQFPALNWYEPGYDAMLLLLESEAAHPVTDATKGEQTVIESEVMWGTGIAYLEAIVHSGKFVDQEAVLPAELFR
jgi:hypothetical protein